MGKAEATSAVSHKAQPKTVQETVIHALEGLDDISRKIIFSRFGIDRGPESAPTSPKSRVETNPKISELKNGHAKLNSAATDLCPYGMIAESINRGLSVSAVHDISERLEIPYALVALTAEDVEEMEVEALRALRHRSKSG